eukprot:TRINITY_DN15549_c0_g1_i1.p1 TRINITY_DN15549_c0_g1~~TRINITY_DN15549_c0_g1_i1.p1  ORF type:complete len:386 (-),score=93.59 TRINITY_DN15549_c0_g1_i1:104-1261(-)
MAPEAGAEASGTITNMDDLSFDKRLGRGFFGEVWKAKEKGGSKRIFAVKKVKLSLIIENRLMDQLKREIAILYSLDHPRIVKLFYDFTDSSSMFLAMEFAHGGTLFEKLSDAKRFSLPLTAKYFYQTCEALDYLHHLPEPIIHRDLKPENILLDGDDGIKVADFGWANMLDADKRNTFCGTLDYLPPEMITGKGHDASVDMWNMGVLLYELSIGDSPFGAKDKETTVRLIMAVDLRFKPGFDKDARDLIYGLCKKNPKERLAVREAMTHFFVKKYHSVETNTKEEEDVGIEGRPSIFHRRLKKETDQILLEKEDLIQAKEQLDQSLAEHQKELEEMTKLFQDEEKHRKELEKACVDLAKANEARERELVELRPKTESRGWFGRRK